MSKSLEILERYWGYTSFRKNQEEIINSALSGKDTIALMPTGGGKSLTFQIPALLTDGIALVVTPLIALIKDQAENLRAKGIPVIAIHSGLSYDEIDALLDNAILGEYKFLYLSPERLNSDLFRARASKMKVNFLVIDEAHCISQWGHDFRPDYLKIKEIKNIIAPIATIAVTATATSVVVEEISKNLGMTSPNILRSSFSRDNLSYVCREDEDKYSQLLKIARNVNGSGIIYVRERRKTFEVSDFLKAHGISAEAYNAAMPSASRAQRQDEWKNGELRIIVATNAFGMGIDKADVRFVCHLDPPESIEAYYQEAGRAGRDGIKSYAVLLWNKQDSGRLRRILSTTFPDEVFISTVYQKLFVYLGIAFGAGKGKVINFSLKDFCSNLSLHPVQAYHALKYIENSPSTEILAVQKDSPAEKGGLTSGDVVLKINSIDVENDAEKLVENISKSETNIIQFTVQRNNEIKDFNIEAEEKFNYYLGINLKMAENNFTNNIYYAFWNTGDFLFSIIDNLKMLFTGNVAVNQLMGPVGIGEVVVETKGISEFVNILALISISLGVTNLLPFPPLDGGKVVILLIEGIRKKPLKENVELKIQMIGFCILIGLSIVVTYNDILRIF